MALIFDLIVQAMQMGVVLLLAPLLTGFVRKVKARLTRRQGPSILQPYRDLLRLLRKEVVLAENASWLFRATPYLIFAATWVAAALIPTFATGLLFSWTADLIAIVALLGSARFFLALAGMDVGTSFGGIGSSREVMIATFAEPAMLLTVFTLALVAGSTQLSTVVAFTDFGTGYSSLGYVHRLPLDRIKIDRSFVTNIETSTVSQSIVKTVLDLCGNLNVDCVVEGAETREQVDILRSFGCRTMQGYYFGKPLPAEEALAGLVDFPTRLQA